MRTGQISKAACDFCWEEFTNSHTATVRGISNIPTDETYDNIRFLAENYLQPLRNHFGAITVTSGYRAPLVNKACGGASDSWHLRGCAADIKAPSALVLCQMTAFVHKRFLQQGIGYQELLPSKNGSSLWLHIAFNPQMEQSAMRCRLIVYK
ncbi:MAG: peptidase M15 [Prevotella sp.]|nr:peptidase M15 [Prevotella sp.]